MYYFLKKHKKWILVVVVTLLMIAFGGMEVIRQWSDAQMNPVVARLGEEELLASTVGDAERGWDILKEITVRRRTSPMSFQEENVYWVATRLGGQLTADIEKNQEFFFLLAEDARRSGVEIPDADADELVRDLAGRVRDVQGERARLLKEAARRLLLIEGLMQRLAANVKVSRPMVERVLATSAQKLTVSLVEFPVDDYKTRIEAPTDDALREQFDAYKNNLPGEVTDKNPAGFGYKHPNRVKLQYLALKRDAVREAVVKANDTFELEVAAYELWRDNPQDFTRLPPSTMPSTTSTAPTTSPEGETEGTPDPTDADVKPDAAPAEDQPATEPKPESDEAAPPECDVPAVQPAAAEDPSEASPAATDPPDTDEPKADAAEAGEDPTEDPAAATEPATTTTTTTDTAPTTEPTLRPFAEVKQEAIDKIVDQKVDAKVREVMRAVHERLNEDYKKYRARNPSTGATTAPATAPADDAFASFDYLRKLAANIQDKHGVLPSISAPAEDRWYDAKALGELEGIGKVTVRQEQFRSIAFGDYVVSTAEPFLPESVKNVPGVNSILEPSPVMADTDENAYVFRLTAVRPAEPPASIDEVKDRVEADLRTKLAYEQALADASAFLSEAKSEGINPASGPAEKTVIVAGPFERRDVFPDSRQFGFDLPPDFSLPVPGYEKGLESITAKRKFVDHAYGLLEQATAERRNPVSLLELPAAGKVLVVQLSEIESTWTADELAAYGSFLSRQSAARRTQELLDRWLNHEAVTARLGFHWTNESAQAPPADGAADESEESARSAG